MAYIYKQDKRWRDFPYTVTRNPWPNSGGLEVASTLWGAERIAQRFEREDAGVPIPRTLVRRKR